MSYLRLSFAGLNGFEFLPFCKKNGRFPYISLISNK